MNDVTAMFSGPAVAVSPGDTLVIGLRSASTADAINLKQEWAQRFPDIQVTVVSGVSAFAVVKAPDGGEVVKDLIDIGQRLQAASERAD